MTRRFSDPDDIDHDEIRRLANLAMQVGHLYRAQDQVAEIYMQEADAQDAESLPEDSPVSIAFNTVITVYEELDRYLESEVATWLAKDPEHWPIFRLTILEPWKTKSDGWRKGVPLWVQMLATNTYYAHFQQDPYGRRGPTSGWLFGKTSEEDDE